MLQEYKFETVDVTVEQMYIYKELRANSHESDTVS